MSKKKVEYNVGDYIWYVHKPYMTIDEGIIIKIIDESCVKVSPVDGDRDHFVLISEIEGKL